MQKDCLSSLGNLGEEMNRFAERIKKLEKVNGQGGRRVHFIIINPGEDPEQTKSRFITENSAGENDVLFIMDLSGES